VAEIQDFRSAGRTLFSLGMVRGEQGNLSEFDGAVLVITRTGVSLQDLDEGDLVRGTLEDEPAGASTDWEVHRRIYLEQGPGAVAHAHPEGSVPAEGGDLGRHGVYAFGPTLTEAAAWVVRAARAGSEDRAR
jgi:ribulose-5-phosphate 4-epimerase/fuculose-1-phosphate aldolase